MSDITSTLSAIANSPATKGVLDIAQLGSTGYNLYNQYQQQQYQNKLRDLASNPQKLAAFAAQYTQPLNAGLQASVANQAQSYLASRGLSDSPQISEQVEAQALAPYIQQNQQQGFQNALQALGLAGGAIPPGQQQANSFGNLAKIFSQLGGQGGQGGGTSLAQLLQLAGSGAPLQTTSPDLSGASQTIPYEPTVNWTPDYTASLTATPTGGQ